MDIQSKIENSASESNFFEYGYVKVENLKYYEEVRTICEGNSCRNYAASWACPPAIGTITECKERIGQYNKMLVFSQKYELEDSFDFESMIEELKDFNYTVDLFQQKVDDILSTYLLLSNEGWEDVLNALIRILLADFHTCFITLWKDMVSSSRSLPMKQGYIIIRVRIL